jgi:hypothetical protein
VWFCQNSIRAVHAGRFRSSARQSRLSGALKTCVHRGQIFYGQAKEPVRPENSCRELSAFGKEIDGVQRRRSTVNDNAACAALGARHAQAVAHRSASADGYAPPVILVGFMIDRQLVAQREDLELQRGARTNHRTKSLQDGNENGAHGQALIEVDSRTQCASARAPTVLAFLLDIS